MRRAGRQMVLWIAIGSVACDVADRGDEGLEAETEAEIVSSGTCPAPPQLLFFRYDPDNVQLKYLVDEGNGIPGLYVTLIDPNGRVPESWHTSGYYGELPYPEPSGVWTLEFGSPSCGSERVTAIVPPCSFGWECRSGQCIAGVCTRAGCSGEETCNGLDDNCNGVVDDGNPGGGGSCSTGRAGVCASGTTRCASGSIVCEATISASTEVCDGLDNDCDGQMDEEGVCGLCSTTKAQPYRAEAAAKAAELGIALTGTNFLGCDQRNAANGQFQDALPADLTGYDGVIFFNISGVNSWNTVTLPQTPGAFMVSVLQSGGGSNINVNLGGNSTSSLGLYISIAGGGSNVWVSGAPNGTSYEYTRTGGGSNVFLNGPQITEGRGSWGSKSGEAPCPAAATFYAEQYGMTQCARGTCWATQPFEGSEDASVYGWWGWYSSCAR